MPDTQTPYKIRSFVLRRGRMTAGQQKALDTLWERYGLEPLQPFDKCQVFERKAPLIVEIGFGDGASLVAIAEANPEINYLGIEVYQPGVAHLLILLNQNKISNVKIYHHDAIDVLEQKIADNSLNGVHLFFPDPWQKRRHHKRRIVRSSFIDLLEKKLVSGGYFHTVTDWDQYAEDMLKMLSMSKKLFNTSVDNRFCSRPKDRFLSKFERRGIKQGHGVWDLVFKKM